MSNYKDIEILKSDICFHNNLNVPGVKKMPKSTLIKQNQSKYATQKQQLLNGLGGGSNSTRVVSKTVMRRKTEILKQKEVTIPLSGQ